MEEWRPIKDYEGLYEVSNMGRVKSYHGKEKILKPWKNSSGYLYVVLSKNNKSKTITIHRLVALHFVDGWFEGAHVDHIDTNRENNIWTNLRWVTYKGNMNNELTKERLSKAHKGKQHTEETKKKMSEAKKHISKKVYCIELDKVFNSITEVSKELNINKGSISKVCRGIYKQIKGYHFIYYEDYLNIV